MTESAGRHLGLRASVLVLGLCAIATLALTGLVPGSVAGGTAVVLVLASTAGYVGLPRPARSVAGFTGLAVATAIALAVVGPGITMLAVAAMWLLVTQQLVADRPRELVVAGILAVVLALLPAGVAPAAVLAVPWLVGWCACVVALVLAVRARERRARNPAAERAAVLTTTGVTLLVAIVAVLVIPLPDVAGGRLASLSSKLPAGASAHRTAFAYQSGDLDLRARGDLPDVPVAQVPLASATHWRMAVLSTYDGMTWVPDAGDGRRLPGDASSGWQVGAALADGPSPGGEARTDTVRLLSSTSGLLLVPTHATTIATAAATANAVGVLPGSRLLAVPPPSQYVVTSAPMPNAADVAGPVGPSAADPTERDWLQLPGSVTRRTRDLAARLAVGATSRGEVIGRIEHYLSTTYPYRLDSPVPPADQDAVDHLLFDAKTGFCEQFASAEVVMLRSLGIPSRLATGYAFGTVRGDTRTLSIPHAWVEVWQPGYGWLTSEPTPASPASAVAGGHQGALAILRGLVDSTRDRWLLAGGLVALGLLVAGAVSLGRRRRRAVAPPVAAGLNPQARLVVQSLARLTAALASAGRPSPPSETISELAARVPEVDRRSMTCAERTVYGRRPPADDLVDEAVRALDAAAIAVTASATVVSPARVQQPIPR